MKTIEAIALKAGLTVLEGGEGLLQESSGIYCCDLLSLAMVRAPAGCAWITVIANRNTVAVAVLREVGCIVISEGMEVKEAVRKEARERGVALLRSNRPTYETAAAIDRALKEENGTVGRAFEKKSKI